MAPFYEKFFQFPFKETVVSDMFHASMELLIDNIACRSSFKLTYVLQCELVLVS